MQILSYGVWVGESLIRPFYTGLAARKFAETVKNSIVTEIHWVIDPKFTAGGHFVKN